MFPLSFWLLPSVVWYSIAFIFGVIIGSFLNVYIYRLHTGKSVTGQSHCLSCGRTLRWFELFPLLSFLGLRGRCRQCGARIPTRYFWVELLTGVLFALTLLLSIDTPIILLYWLVMSVLVVITVYDLYHFIIPDELTVFLTFSLSAMFGYQFLLGNITADEIIVTVFAALAGSAFFGMLWLVSKGAWLGFGDVKLAIPLGILVGPTAVFSFVVLSFWIGAGVSLLILGYQKWKRGKAGLHLAEEALTMKSAVPFAPFLVASSLIVLFTQFDVLQLFTTI